MRNLDQQRRLWRRAGVAVAVLALLSLALPVASWAGVGTTFTDVPPTHPFVDEIEEVADAGVANGFPDGSYRPAQAVTRQAMAAFLSRAGSSIAYDEAGAFNLTSTQFQTVGADVRVDAHGDFEDELFLNVRGTVTFFDSTPPAACDPTCVVGVQLRNVITGTFSPEVLATLTYIEDGGDILDSVTVDWATPVSGGFSRWVVQARMVQTSGVDLDSLTIGSSHASATVIPFDANFAG